MKLSAKFSECIDLQNFLWCPVPRIAMKVNLALVDQYITLKKTEKRPNAMEDCIKSVIMLKAATLLGDSFDTMSLQSLSPLQQKETVEQLNRYLKQLEAFGFIEIVDESDKENFKCRFNKPFLRESLY